MNSYIVADIVKALHIIFVVSWFSGLFYLVRIFIYHAEADKKEEPAKSILQNQYKIMEGRVWNIISWPAAILTLISGLYLAYYYNFWIQPWMLVKFVLVIGLFAYHFACGKMVADFKNDVIKHGSFKLRLWNEVATLLLFGIVFVVELKNEFNFYWGFGALVVLCLLIWLATKKYKKKRESSKLVD